VRSIRECLFFDFMENRNRKRAFRQRFSRLKHRVHRYAHRGAQLGSCQIQIVPGPNEFLLSRCHAHLRSQQVGLHYQPAVEPRLTAIHDGLGRLHRLLGDLKLLARQQYCVICVDDSEDDLLIGALQLVDGRLVHLSCPIHTVPTGRESNRFQVPPKRVLKFPKGKGVFSLFSARSAEVKSCCRSSLPNTYTGSFPRVAVSEKVSFGRKTDRASRMSADATFVSASATLRSGFFSSAILTACVRVRAAGSADG